MDINDAEVVDAQQRDCVRKDEHPWPQPPKNFPTHKGHDTQALTSNFLWCLKWLIITILSNTMVQHRILDNNLVR